MQIIDLERRLDDLEFRMAAQGLGEGFCDCGEPALQEHVQLLLGGSLRHGGAKRVGLTHEQVIEVWTEVNRCKSEVHNPRLSAVRSLTLAEKDALVVDFLGGRELVEKAIADLEILETQPPKEYFPLIEKVPEPPPEPTLPDRIAQEILQPKKTPAEMLLVPENVAKEQALELSYRMGAKRPEPDDPEVKVTKSASIEPIAASEVVSAKEKRQPVSAIHEQRSVSLRHLLERCPQE